MGKLTECSVCGKEMAESAMSCPHCGAKYKNTLGDYILVFIKLGFKIILVITALGVLGGISSIIFDK